VAAEAEGVRDADLDLLVPRLIWDVVEVTGRIRRRLVDRRRQAAPLQSEDREDRLDHARRALPNGMTLLVVPNHQVPFVSVGLHLKSGAWCEAKPGACAMAMISSKRAPTPSMWTGTITLVLGVILRARSAGSILSVQSTSVTTAVAPQSKMASTVATNVWL
jgi:hypothetical protein